MKKFVKDYVELCKASNNFYKKHWFGVIVLNVVSFAGMFAWFTRDQIKDAVKEKFHKNEGEEEA